MPSKSNHNGAEKKLGIRVLILLILSCGCVSSPVYVYSQLKMQTENTMKVLHQTSPMDIQEEVITLKPLQQKGPDSKPLPVATAPGNISYHCPYANEQQNSRSGPLPKGKWVINWKTPLLSQHTPRFVLNDGAYTVVQASTWQIFHKAGIPVGNGLGGPGQIFVTNADNLMFSIDMNGYLAANQLSDGQRKYILSTWGGDLAAFNFIQKQDSELLVTGFELPKSDFERPPEAPHEPESSIVHMIRIGDSVQVSSNGLLTGTSSKSLHIEATPLKTARCGNTLVCAVPGGLFFVDQELTIKAAFALKANPLALSLDEAGNAYLILASGGQNELWMVTPKGELVFSSKLPTSTDRFPIPPVIGYNHAVFISLDSTLLAFDSAGKLIWNKTLPAKPGGMIVTPENELIVCDGSELVIFNEEGKRIVLFEFSGDNLATPPAITENGEILVATQQSLFSLHAQ